MVGKALATTLASSRAERAVIMIGAPLVGLAIGAILPVVARWGLDLSVGLPFRPVWRAVGGVDRPWEVAVNLAIWLAVGLGVAYSALGESVRLTLTDDRLRIEQRDRAETIDRADVADVFLDRDAIVVLDHRSLPLARDPNPASRERTAEISVASLGSTGFGGVSFTSKRNSAPWSIQARRIPMSSLLRGPVGGICSPPSPFTRRRISLLSALLPMTITGP